MEEFLRGDAGGAEFADDNAGGGVREHGGVRERSAGGRRECEHAENGVAGASHVEYLTARGAALDAGLAHTRVGDFKAGRRDVNAPRRSFIEHVHPLVTARDDYGAAAEVREQGEAGFFDCKRAGDEKSCFLCVANDGAGATIRVEARSFWLHENGNFQLMRGAEDAVGEVVGDETFVVVGENERVEMFERGKKQAQKFFLSFVAERFAALVIHANNLLVAGNNARFYGGDALRIGDNSFVHDVCGAQTFLQSAPGFIISNNAEHFHFGAERGNVCADVAGAAEAFALLDEINDGNRRFRRKARGRAPEVAIEHQVSEDADAPSAQAGDPSFQARNGIGDVVGHAGSFVFSVPPGIILERWSLLRAALRECRRAPDRRGGTLRISGLNHRRAVSPAPCKRGKLKCREVPLELARASPSRMKSLAAEQSGTVSKGVQRGQPNDGKSCDVQVLFALQEIDSA